MRHRRIAVLAVALAAVGLTAAACSSSSGGGTQKGLSDQSSVGPYLGSGLQPPEPRPSFTLTDTSGKKFSFSSTSGHPTFLFFGYTHCPDDCPETMADIRLALTKVPAATAERTDVVFVTTDVKRDTGARIHQWLAGFDTGSKAHWIGLNGTQSQINAAQAAAHITLASDGGETHSALALLYGPDNYARVGYLPTGKEANQMAHDLPVVDKAA